jgi:Fe-S cluster biogenesis protein NfuA
LEEIQRIIDEKIRPQLQAHNGDIKLIGIKDGIITVKLTGACSGCPGADLTTKDFMEEVFSQYIPKFKKVVISHEVSQDLMDMAKSILKK